MTQLMSWVLMVLGALVGVAFVTLLERKILGFSQLRLGPNKPGFVGLLQPGADAIKLFTKQQISLSRTLNRLFGAGFAIALVLALMVWSLAPTTHLAATWSISLPQLLMLLSLSVYPILIMGWASKNSYSTLGALRGVAQSISYEVSLAFLLMSMVMLYTTSSFLPFFISESNSQKSLTLGLLILWLVVAIAESNRTPYDFAEGESELVSGFNTEYGGGAFAIIFMAEYAMILVLASISVSLFLSNSMSAPLWATLLAAGWVWLRATFPRHRYDLLMNVAWKTLLPWALTILILVLLLL